jgi:hypothetical protein
MLEPEKYPNHMCGEYKLGGNIMEGFPCGGSMYEIYSMFEEYDEIAMTAMELVLTKGPDALMGQLNYDDIEFVKTFPAVYKRAIELGILKEE